MQRVARAAQLVDKRVGRRAQRDEAQQRQIGRELAEEALLAPAAEQPQLVGAAAAVDAVVVMMVVVVHRAAPLHAVAVSRRRLTGARAAGGAVVVAAVVDVPARAGGRPDEAPDERGEAEGARGAEQVGEAADAPPTRGEAAAQRGERRADVPAPQRRAAPVAHVEARAEQRRAVEQRLERGAVRGVEHVLQPRRHLEGQMRRERQLGQPRAFTCSRRTPW